MKETAKEEKAIILDFLPNGYPFDARPMFKKTPIAQAIGKDHFILLELIPKKGVFLQPYEEVYMGEGKRDSIHHISTRLTLDRLTQTARNELDHILKELVQNKESRFVEFFNKAGPINMRRHQIELLPGIGKKHMWEILERREEKPFENFQDIKNRVRLLPNPEQMVIRRILIELNNEDKHKIFVET